MTWAGSEQHALTHGVGRSGLGQHASEPQTHDHDERIDHGLGRRRESLRGP